MYLLTGNAAAALSPRAVYAVPTFLQKGGGLKTSVLVYPVLLMRKQCWNKEWYLKINIWVQHTGRLSLFAHFMQLLLWRYWTRLCWRHWSLGTIHCYVFNLYNEASSLLSIFGANNRNELNSMSISHVLADFLLPLLSSHSARRNWRCKLVFCSWSSRLFAVESFRLRADIQIRNMFRQGSEVFSVKLLYLFH